MGVYDPKLTEMFAGVLKNLGTKRAFVVHGSDGLDEATVTGKPVLLSSKTELSGLITLIPLISSVKPIHWRPFAAVSGTNAEITKDVLTGKIGACRTLLLLTPPWRLWPAKRQWILKKESHSGDCIDSGAAVKKLAGAY